jgi:hypothetical protein
MVHRRQVGAATVAFGNQGDLWGNAMTWWDHDTGSVWSQPFGEAILGPLKGERLELLPSTLTTWEAWRAAYPGTLALDVAAWTTGFHLEQMAVVVDFGTDAAAYAIPPLRKIGVVNDVVGGVEIAVVIDDADPARWAVFSRRLDASLVELELRPQGLVDVATGTVFDPFLGVGRSGPLGDQTLDKLPAFTSFPEDYAVFFPDGRLWPQSGDSS